jgi:hypothetical protein
MSIDSDLADDGFSSVMGTETLPAHDLVPDGLPASSRRPGTPYWRDKIPGTILVTERFDPIAWWSQPDIEGAFSTLQRWALGVFACPATSCKYGRAFSSAKKRITPERNVLGDSVIEALKCLRAWWNNGLIKRL